MKYTINEIEEAAQVYISFAKDGIKNDGILDDVQISAQRTQKKFWEIVDRELTKLGIQFVPFNYSYQKLGA